MAQAPDQDASRIPRCRGTMKGIVRIDKYQRGSEHVRQNDPSLPCDDSYTGAPFVTAFKHICVDTG